MARCKEEPKVETTENFTARISAEVEKDYGEGILISGEQLVAQKKILVPWSPALDIILSGGIEEGSWVGITGNEKHGKTTAALTLAANAQRPEYGSRPIYYAKVEGRLSTTHLKGIQGLDLTPGKFNIIQSKKGRILSAQDYLTILTNIVRSVPGAFIIIDSISTLVEEKELNEGVGTETRGGGAKLFSQFLRTLNQVVPVNDTIVIGITHLISNTSGFGAAYMERAARAWKYQKDYDLKAVKKKPWKSGEKQIGFEIEWVCNTSRNGPPGMKIDSFLRFGVGLDRLFEAINLGVTAGLVKKAGSWLSLEFLGRPAYAHLLQDGEVPKVQGAEKLYQLLLEHPEFTEALNKELGSLAGSLATTEE